MLSQWAAASLGRLRVVLCDILGKLHFFHLILAFALVGHRVQKACGHRVGVHLSILWVGEGFRQLGHQPKILVVTVSFHKVKLKIYSDDKQITLTRPKHRAACRSETCQPTRLRAPESRSEGCKRSFCQQSEIDLVFPENLAHSLPYDSGTD